MHQEGVEVLWKVGIEKGEGGCQEDDSTTWTALFHTEVVRMQSTVAFFI